MLRNQRGMTLIEIMIVIAILAGLMAILAPKVQQNFKKARIKQTYLAMGEIGKGLDLYYTDCGTYPTTEQGLKALMEAPSTGCSAWGPDPYLKKNLLKDPWGHEYDYSWDGNGQPLLKSQGDGKKELTSIDGEKD